MKQIILYGVPGTGKSTIGRRCAQELHIPFRELDLIRDTLPASDDNPYLRTPSTLAWQLIGPLNKENATVGFMRVRRALRPYVSQTLGDIDTDFVAESAFIDPHNRNTTVALIVIRSPERHYSQFFVHRQASAETDRQFEAARYVQGSLIQEALELEIPIVENDTSLELSVKSLLKSLRA